MPKRQNSAETLKCNSRLLLCPLMLLWLQLAGSPPPERVMCNPSAQNQFEVAFLRLILSISSRRTHHNCRINAPNVMMGSELTIHLLA